MSISIEMRPRFHPREIAIETTRAVGKSLNVFLVFLCSCFPSTTMAGEPAQIKKVVLLHGLARSPETMVEMGKALQGKGYSVCNIGYPSTSHSVEELAMNFVAPAIKGCIGDAKAPVDFVTHSMGGIVVRYLASHVPGIEIGRVVMLSPPNRGSEVVDAFGDMWLFELINGPAGKQLGTGKESIPNSLGPARFELGIVTGNRSINWILSAIIDGENDGKVSVEKAKLEGMKDFLVVTATHPFIMKNDIAIMQTLHFLEHGHFLRESEQ